MGDFDWGPDSRRWIPRRTGDTRDAVAAFWPLVAVVIGAALMALGGGLVWASPAAGDLVAQPPSPESPGKAAVVEPDKVVVHVTGHVEEPGIVSVPIDSRASDAMEAAGGPLPDAD